MYTFLTHNSEKERFLTKFEMTWVGQFVNSKEYIQSVTRKNLLFRNMVFLVLVGFPCIFDQCRDGHRSDASRRGRDGVHRVLYIFEVRIPIGFSVNKGRSDIDDDWFFSDHFTREKSWLPDGDDDNISTFRDVAHVWRRCVTRNHCGSRIDEHEWHRFPDDIRSSEYGNILPAYIDMIVLEKGHDTFRRTAPESWMREKHVAYLYFRESIDIFRRVDTFDDRITIEVIRKWCLDDNPMNRRIERKLTYFILYFLLRHFEGKSVDTEIHADFFRTEPFHANVCETRRIFSDEYDDKKRSLWSRESCYLSSHASEHLWCDEMTIEYHKR